MTPILGAGSLAGLQTALETSFVYLLIAAFCSTVTEWISALLNTRPRMLAAAIHELLDGQSTTQGLEFAAEFYAHPVVTAMMDRRRHPSHLPTRAFVTAVVDLATPEINGPLTFASFAKSLDNLPHGEVRTTLQALIQNAGDDLARAEANIEAWFNDAMSRASRSYKQRAACWTALVAAIITLVLNADSIAMLRGSSPGWDVIPLPISLSEWVTRLAGWSITIAAVSLGTPFWFAVLKRYPCKREP